jgi:drug/metabolite transporter (DMT)-like permease
MFVVTIAALVILQQKRRKHWRGVFATLTGIGLLILGYQDGVFSRDKQWYMSHFYFGILTALLMIFSLAIFEKIYQDCSNGWRSVHII